MDFNLKIQALRKENGLTSEKFAEKFNVSRQAVSKWETGESMPDIENIVKIAKYFNVTLDYLLLDSNVRTLEENESIRNLQPNFEMLHIWELYSEQLNTEYTQCLDEGLDIEKYSALFNTISKLEKGIIKEQFANIIFEYIVAPAKMRRDFTYNEPSSLCEIHKLSSCDSYPVIKTEISEDKIKGAWYGRICGCSLGKVLEGCPRDELVPFLKETDNYPMHRYVLSTDIDDGLQDKYVYNFVSKSGFCVDKLDFAPTDDDTNYTVLYQNMIERFGRDFTPADVASIWMNSQPKTAYCTAERAAFRNFVNGYCPPASAIYKNPYREWIGAQIRGDYFGYINPGNPKVAADMAFRDASISHTKNGIYGEMFVAAMLARAAVSDDIIDIITCGISQIPTTSRLYEEIHNMVEDYKKGVGKQEALEKIYDKYNDRSSYDWCHTISNARIVVYAILYGENDYGKSICLAVEAAFDTDCNGATVGSILGMKNGFASIGEKWTKCTNGKLQTSISGMNCVDINTLVDKTIKHIG